MTPANYSYGDAGDEYVVTQGDVWAVGPHRFCCADLEADDGVAIGFAQAVEPWDVTFVDPPWGKGLARSYRTKAQVDGERGRPVDFVNLLTRIGRIAGMAREAAFVEIGYDWVDDVIGTWEGDRLAELAAEVDVFYYGTDPCVLVAFATPQSAVGTTRIAEVALAQRGLDEAAYTRNCVGAFATGGRVFDTCTGQGLTARVAVEVGAVFAGTELHPRRMAEAMRSVAKITGDDVVKLGRWEGDPAVVVGAGVG